jgi:hypothetical protein
MSQPYTSQDYREFKAHWQSRIEYTPSAYQFTIWLGLYRLQALKDACDHTARWLKRTLEKQTLTTDDLIRYYSATARNINKAMIAAERMDAEAAR